MYQRLIQFFYPGLSIEEAKKYGLLSLLFVVIIGTYWVLRLLKNTIFMKVAFPVCFGWDLNQGCQFQPLAKIWSPFFMLILLLIYSRLVDVVKRYHLFYIFSLFYAASFALFAGLLFVRNAYGVEVLGKTLMAGLGWSSYLVIDSFGSLFVALFWSYANSISDPDSAEYGFPLVVALAQISATVGSSIVFFSGTAQTLWPLMFIAALLVLTIIPIMRYFISQMADDPLVSLPQQSTDEKEGFVWGAFEGIVMLLTRPYLFGLLMISILYEAITAILDYQMISYASSSSEFSTEAAFMKFQGLYGMGVNIMACFIALFLTSAVIHRLGTRISLLVYPFLLGIAIFFILFCYYSGFMMTHILWVLFCILVPSKAIGYALNNPVTETMFITTSKKANFKSKGWIDTFGSRFAKAGGARFTQIFQTNVSALLLYGSLMGLGLVGIWVVWALYVGATNAFLKEREQIVE